MSPNVSVAKALVDEDVTRNNVAEPGETLTYEITLANSGAGAATDFDFIENVPDGATMTSVTGANGFTTPVQGPATVQLTVPLVAAGATEKVRVQFAVATPIPLGVTSIRNLISGGDIPPGCTTCSVSIPTPPPVPTGVPTMSCTTSGAYFNTAYNGAGGKLVSGKDSYWAIATTTTPVTGAPPAGLSYTAATVVSNPSMSWMVSPFGNANWIAHSATGGQAANLDSFYRYQFNLDPAVDPASLDLKMTFYADNAVHQVWVNGVAQGIQSNYGAADPYYYGGFLAGGGATGSLRGNWQTGLNTIVVHSKSAPGFQGLMAQINPVEICQPKVTLRKAVVNDNGGSLTPADFTLRASGPKVVEGAMGAAVVTNASIPAGTYTLSEDAVASYTSDQYSCAVDGAAAVVGNSLSLANGQNAICTITNDDIGPKLTLLKSVTNDNGGTAVAADFTLTATGPVSISGIAGSAAVTDASVGVGTYTLGEVNSPGYTTWDYSCVVNGAAPVSGNTVALALGDEAVCTVVNDDQPARLTLAKTVVNDNGGAAVPADFTLSATGPTPISGVSGNAAVTAVAVDAGSYTLSEANLPGYTAGTYSCVVNGGAAVSGSNLALVPGDVAVCSVTNDDEAARLTLAKTVANDNGGTAQVSDFTLTATGPVTIAGKTGTPVVTSAEVPAGTYALTESNLPGYAGGDYSCAVDGGAAVSGNSLTLGVGQEAVCAIVNDDMPARLTLVKTVTNDNGGVATPANFTLTATGPVIVSGVTGSAAVTDAAVPAGTYVLRETNLPGYTGSDYACVVNGGAAVVGNTLALANGDAAVCAIANDDQPATLTLVKTLVNDDGGIAAATDFTLSATGPATITGETGSAAVTAVSVPAGSYVLSEANLPGYSSGPFSCVINGAPQVSGNALTLVSGDSAVCEVVNDDVPPAVAIRKQLTGESMTVDEVPQPDEVLTYQITLTNSGGTASNYSLTDVLDGNVDFVSASHGGVLSGTDIVWNGLTVPAHDGTAAGVLALTVSVQVKNPLPAGQTTVTNMAKQTGSPDPDCPSDQCVQIPAPPKITIKKALVGESIASDRLPVANEVLTYEIALTNTGGAAINYSVTDVLDANVTFQSADNGGVASAGEVVWNGLTVPAQVGAVPGTLVLTVNVVVNDPLAAGAIVTNLVKETGKPDPICPSDQCVQIPDPAHITIQKSLVGESGGTLPGIAEPGETLTYRIRLANNGGATNSYAVTDKLDSNTLFSSASHGGVDVGGAVEWTNLAVPAYSAGTPGILDLTVVVIVDDPLPVGTTEVANIALETGQPEPDCPSAQCAQTPTPPVIAIDKKLSGESGSRVGVAEPGETLTYQITLTNTGGAASGHAVTDRLDPNVSFVSASDGGTSSGSDVNWSGLSVPAQSGGEPGTLVLTVRTKVASPLPVGVTSVSNIAFETGQPEPSCPSVQCVELPTPPNVTIKKTLMSDTGGSLPGVAEPGETLVYKITLTNTGGPATGFSVVDKLDPNVSFGFASPGSVWDNGSTVTWSGLSVPQQAGATPGKLELFVHTIVNTPVPAGVTKIGNVVYETGEPEPVCPSDQCVSLPTPPAITIAKALTGESGSRAGIAEPGETLTYTITLTNVGGAATGYAVTDSLDANVTFANASDGGALSGSDVNWSGLSVPAQIGVVPGTRTLVVRTRVKDPLPVGVTKVSNIAVKTGDPLPSCPSAQCVEIPTPPAVSASKQLTGESIGVDTIAEPGETLTYTITLTNAGGTDFAGYRLTENVPAGATLTSVTGASGFTAPVSGAAALDLTVASVPANSSAVVTVTFLVADPLPAGTTQVTNTISGGDLPPDCAAACAVTTLTPAKVTVDKRLTGESFAVNGVAQPGEVLTYAITLTNAGGTAFTNFDLTENVPAGATLTSVTGASGFTAPVAGPGTADLVVATVPANGTATVTVRFTVDDPLADGVASIVNTVSGGDIDPACATCSVTTPTAPKVTVAKALTAESIAADSTAQPGEVLTYTITLTNAGGSDFAGFDLTENVPVGATLTSVTGASGFGSAVAGPGTANLSVATVPANDTATVTVVFTVDDPLADGLAAIVNTVSGGDIDPACTTCSVTVPTGPKMTVAKALTDESIAVNDIAEPGEVLTYTITLTNAGGSAFTNFDFTENVPAGATLTSVTGATGFTAAVAGPGTLDLTVATVPANDTATVTIEFTIADPIPAGLTEIANTISGGDLDPACTTCEVTTPTAKPELKIVKSGAYEDTDGSGSPTPGDRLSYSFVVTNTGNLALDNVDPVDAGPIFNGQPAGGSLSAITPAPLTLAPGAAQTFTATYDLTQADIDNAAGIDDGVDNTARARGYRNGVIVPSNLVESNDSIALLALPAAAPSDITVTKQAGLRFIRIGEKAPYTITVTNNSVARVSGLTVTDVMPAGFRFVEGSATVDGVAVTPAVNGRNIVFENLALNGSGKIEIRLQLMALSSAGPGKHINTAIATDDDGNPLAPEAKASVEILAEPVFDCGEIIGKVFDDKNRNGYQDEGEPGLPGVRLATVKGVLVTTDAHGRFHVACADLPQRIGSNFIMKLDTRTLPSGYRLTTENPRVVRLTAGKMTKLNFGASVGRIVKLDLKDEAFVAGETALRPEWNKGLDHLVELLGKEPSILRIRYLDATAGKDLTDARMRALDKEIASRWRAAGHRSSLDVETRVEASK
ncbi:DUF7507 domain-containing protein [Aminobacter sp. HY435]|uniref:DUF7507 domain-containing protein n=1 Tax=Aminobacter sp. HY435 TaxID=2970917 RepID=UPI0022B98296|nr:hypothetical protein [Aminobacter sp. HY435]